MVHGEAEGETDECFWPLKWTLQQVREQIKPGPRWQRLPCRVLCSNNDLDVVLRMEKCRAYQSYVTMSEPTTQKRQCHRHRRLSFDDSSSDDCQGRSQGSSEVLWLPSIANHPTQRYKPYHRHRDLPSGHHSKRSCIIKGGKLNPQFGDCLTGCELSSLDAGIGVSSNTVEELLERMSSIETRQERMERKIDKLLLQGESLQADLRELLQRLVSNTPLANLPTASAGHLPIPLPLTSSSTMGDLNTALASEKERSLYFHYLSQARGETPSEMIRRILNKLLTNEAAMKISFHGLGKKIALKSYVNIVSLLSEVVRISFATVSDKDIESCMTKWFRGCTDRAGGRERRRQKAARHQQPPLPDQPI